MADLILECVRAGRGGRLHTREQLLRMASRLAPSNISARPTRIIETQDLTATIVNPSEEGVRAAEGGVLLGGVIGEAGRWWEVGSEPPDGTYVLVRYSGASVELLSDITASRTLWYAQDEERLVASTSQRAAVALLRCAQVRAAAQGRDFVTPDDVQDMAHPVLRHRIILKPEAEIEGLTVEALVDGVISAVPVPR